jgi:hypothetical protein
LIGATAQAPKRATTHANLARWVTLPLTLPAPLAQPAPQLSDLSRQIVVLGLHCVALGDQHDIHALRKNLLAVTPGLPQQPLDAVSAHGVAHLAADRDPDATCALVRPHTCQDMLKMDLGALALDRQILAPLSEPLVPAKPSIVHGTSPLGPAGPIFRLRLQVLRLASLSSRTSPLGPAGPVTATFWACQVPNARVPAVGVGS